MYDQPGMSKGLEVPIKMERLLDDDKKAKEFAKNAEKMVKKIKRINYVESSFCCRH